MNNLNYAGFLPIFSNCMDAGVIADVKNRCIVSYEIFLQRRKWTKRPVSWVYPLQEIAEVLRLFCGTIGQSVHVFRVRG